MLRSKYRIINAIIGAGLLFWLAFVIYSTLWNEFRVSDITLDDVTSVFDDRVPIGVAGTGSMYPTFPKGSCTEGICPDETVAEPLMHPFSRDDDAIRFGDIISFYNEKTKEITEKAHGEARGYIKRVIGIAGDTLEIRDGFVWRNGLRIDEPYTAEPRSTFGGDFASECQAIRIPDGKLFVMGDNRKGSGDSRAELGLVDIADIDHYLPLSEQEDYRSLWRGDSSHDAEQAEHPVLGVSEFVSLINEKRLAKKRKPLIYDEKLAQSADKRLVTMATYDDFSYEAKKSGYGMNQALRDVKYYNRVWGEGYSLGYYTAQELLESYAESSKWEDFILDADYQDIGIAARVVEVNDCPTQVIVLHMGGYVPPNYKAEDIASWKSALAGLKKVRPSWRNWDKDSDFYEKYKKDIKRLNEIIDLRIARMEKIIARMEAKQWLTAEEERFVTEDDALFEEEDKLAEKINKAIGKWYE